LRKLENYTEDKREKYENQKDKEKYLEDLDRKTSALVELIYHESPSLNQSVSAGQREQLKQMDKIKTAQDLIDHIKSIFKGIDTDTAEGAEALKNIDKHKTVILTTAHKSKGLEFERVNIIGDELFPEGSSYEEDQHDEEARQLHNLKYVAYTRATHNLNISKTPKK
jgi:superfamily I DNA/RNA helicase